MDLVLSLCVVVRVCVCVCGCIQSPHTYIHTASMQYIPHLRLCIAYVRVSTPPHALYITHHTITYTTHTHTHNTHTTHTHTIHTQQHTHTYTPKQSYSLCNLFLDRSCFPIHYFLHKRTIELGSGLGLLGLVICHLGSLNIII